MTSESGRSTPLDIRGLAQDMQDTLLPEKSRRLYIRTHTAFKDWCLTKSVTNISENVLLVYFQQQAENKKASTLWAIYSMLKSTLCLKENLDISKYFKLLASLKRKNDTYKPKKSSVFLSHEITMFLMEANDEVYLTTKERVVHLSPEEVSEIYEKYYGDATFPYMVVTMSIAPIYVLSLGAINAVDKWKSMVGPDGTLREEWFYPYSIRTRFGISPDLPQVLHASENLPEAKGETRFFFARDILEPLANDADQVKDYITLMIKPSLLNGLAEVVKAKPIDPIIYLAEWLLLHNPYQPRLPEVIALTPT